MIVRDDAYGQTVVLSWRGWNRALSHEEIHRMRHDRWFAERIIEEFYRHAMKNGNHKFSYNPPPIPWEPLSQSVPQIASPKKQSNKKLLLL